MCRIAEQEELVAARHGQFVVKRDDHIGLHLKWFGVFQGNELRMLLEFIHPDDCVVEVGAHVGTFTVPCATRVAHKGRVYAFEAYDPTYRLLERNIEINRCGDRVHVYRLLVTDEPGEYMPTTVEGNTGATAFLYKAGGVSSSCEFAVRLDDWWGNHAGNQAEKASAVNVMKLDCEGMELRVLRSAQSVLERFRPVMLIEINRKNLARHNATVEDIECLLREYGYHFFINLYRGHEERYKLGRLRRLTEGGHGFDILAVHPASHRYPGRHIGPWKTGVRTRSRLLWSAVTYKVGSICRRIRGVGNTVMRRG
jgi:FkbM family methyltransferase